jgi:acetyltransferase-like isoleucine patch superfamily enzyme
MKKLIKYSFFGIHKILQRLNTFISSGFMKLTFFLYDVTSGKRLKFFGITHIRFHPQSTVIIGDDCTFRSSFSSNTIGLKQKCFLSANKGANLIIGNSCGLSGVVISVEKNIVIGNRVFFGANVTICDSDRHPIDSKLRLQGFKGDIAPVHIHDDVWIGMNSVVLKGVTIGKGTVVGANSLVNKNLPENVIAAGSPAKIIKYIRADDANL